MKDSGPHPLGDRQPLRRKRQRGKKARVSPSSRRSDETINTMDRRELDVLRLAALRQTLIHCIRLAGDDPQLRALLVQALDQQESLAAARLSIAVGGAVRN